LGDYLAHGARRVRLLRSFYIPERNHPLPLDDGERRKWGSDVVFVGHFENDGRLELLEAIAAAGYDLRIWGFEWEEPMRRSAVLRGLPPPVYLGGDAYNRVLNASKIVLCFLSTINRDTYTRRCFEVPASGAFLLSQYSDDLATLFAEGVEADFFRNRDELLAKIGRWLADDGARRAVADAGRRRVQRDGHDVVSRMAEAVRVLEMETS
jgi:spore maturation protein CgeB